MTYKSATVQAGKNGYYSCTLFDGKKRARVIDGFGTLQKAADCVREAYGIPIADAFEIRRCDGNRRAFGLFNVARHPDGYGHCILTSTLIGPLVAAAASGTKAATVTIDLESVRSE
jgi:hypothetical protein